MTSEQGQLLSTSPSPIPAVDAHVIAYEGNADSSLFAQVSTRQVVGRAVVIWVTAYLTLRFNDPIGASLRNATLVAAIWLPLTQWASRTSHTMGLALGTIATAGVASLAGLAAVSAIELWVPSLDVGRKPTASLALLIFLAVGTWDYFVRRTAHVPRRVLVVGGADATRQLLDDLEREKLTLFEVVAIVDDDVHPDLRLRVGHVGSLEDLSRVVERVTPDLVVVAVTRDRPEVFRQLLHVASAGFRVVGLPEVYEFAFGRLPVRNLTAAWFMSALHLYNQPYSRFSKRAFDVTIATLGLVLTLPVVLLVLVVIKRTPGPLLFRQRRIGENGAIFTMLKFRSMRTDAERAGEAVWASKGDPRVIPAGHLLRRSRLDELPQLWNVLKGDMSVVGPRPERPEFVAQLEAEIPFWTRRHLLKPGITGWAQIRADYAADTLGTEQKLAYDLWYLRHRSLLLDAVICLKTIPGMISGRGAR
jgi:exopolysaccharide biosynthesis polyprenyl glycosylphosphotransferase